MGETLVFLEDTILAYLAGFFDGEGHIIIVRDKSRSGFVNYKLRIGARQVRIEPLDMLRIHFGGIIQYQEKDNPRHQNIYSWELHSKRAVTALKTLLPYLIVKKDQAEFAIKWADKNAAFKGKKKTIEDYEGLELDKLTLSNMKRVSYG